MVGEVEVVHVVHHIIDRAIGIAFGQGIACHAAPLVVDPISRLIAVYIVIVKGVGIGRVETEWGLYFFTALVMASIAVTHLTKP